MVVGYLQKTFYRKRSRKVVEFSECVFAALYDANTFAEDMGNALQKAHSKYGETRNVLVIDVSPHGSTGAESWMEDIMPKVLNTHLIHLGPYHLLPTLSSLFEISADIYQWLNSGYQEGIQRIVLLVARNERSKAYRPFTALSLAASAYLSYVAQHETAVEALDDFKKIVLNGNMVSEMRVANETGLPNLKEYLKFFSILRLHRAFPSSRPLIIVKILAQGHVEFDGKPWNPKVRVHHAGYEDYPGYSTEVHMPDDGEKETYIGNGYASFDADELIFGDIVISFENEVNHQHVPLFSIARHSRFLKAPCERIKLKECELAPEFQHELRFGEDFAVDIYLEDAPLPKSIEEGDFSEAALMEYVKSFGKEHGRRIGAVVDDSDMVIDIANNAPLAPPPVYYSMSNTVGAGQKNANFIAELKSKQEERERQAQAMVPKIEGDGTERTAAALAEVLGVEIDRETVDAFIGVFEQYVEVVADEDTDDADQDTGSEHENKAKRAEHIIGKTFIRPSGTRSNAPGIEDEWLNEIGDITEVVEVPIPDAAQNLGSEINSPANSNSSLDTSVASDVSEIEEEVVEVVSIGDMENIDSESQKKDIGLVEDEAVMQDIQDGSTISESSEKNDRVEVEDEMDEEGKEEKKESNETNIDVEEGEKEEPVDDSKILSDAVRTLLIGINTTGKSERVKVDDAIGATDNTGEDNPNEDLIAQISGALQTLMSEKKYVTQQEIVSQVKLLRNSNPPTPNPNQSGAIAPPPPPPPPALKLNGQSANGAPPPPPPPATGLRPPTGAPAKSGAPFPPPPPQPSSGGLRPPVATVGGATGPPPPPPPAAGGLQPPAAAPGGVAGPPPPPPPAAGGLRPPAAAPGGVPGPPPPPPPAAGGLRPPTAATGGSAAPPPPTPPPGSGLRPPTVPGAPSAASEVSAAKPPPPPPPGGLRLPSQKPSGGPPPPPAGGLRPPTSGPPGPPPAGGLRKPATQSAPGGPTPAATPAQEKNLGKSKTKALHWNTISNMRYGKSVFADAKFQSIVELGDDMKSELEEQFSNATKKKETVEVEEEQKGPSTAGILEAQRIQNFEIVLRKFEASPKEIAEAVRSLDPLGKVLSLDNVNALLSNELKDEELVIAKDHQATDEEVASMNKGEALAYHLARVPRLKQKVQTMYAIRNLRTVVGEVTTQIENVELATNQVKTSEKFKQILASVLAIGNHMNQGTAKGSAKGFRLESLLRLSETKMRDGGLTLLHYLANVLEKKHPEVLDLASELQNVKGAMRMSKEDIAKEVLQFQKSVHVMGREITATSKEESGNSKKKPPPSVSADMTDKDGEKKEKERNPVDVAIELHREAEENMEVIKKNHADMQTGFTELAAYLGEDVRNAKIEELFATINNFVQQFEKCVKENKEKKDNEERKQRMAKKKEEREAEMAKKKKIQQAKAEKLDWEREQEGNIGSQITETDNSPAPIVA